MGTVAVDAGTTDKVAPVVIAVVGVVVVVGGVLVGENMHT